MRSKGIKGLSTLSDADLFNEVSVGLEMIIEHALCIDSEARFLAEQNKPCGYNILTPIFAEL